MDRYSVLAAESNDGSKSCALRDEMVHSYACLFPMTGQEEKYENEGKGKAINISILFNVRCPNNV